MGRYTTQVRICSCPGRDIKVEEDKITDEPASEQPGANNLIPIPFPPLGKKGKTKKRKTTPTTSSSSPSSLFNTQHDGDVYRVNLEVYTLLHVGIIAEQNNFCVGSWERTV